MKFGRYLEKQEEENEVYRGRYVDYRKLKTMLKMLAEVAGGSVAGNKHPVTSLTFTDNPTGGYSQSPSAYFEGRNITENDFFREIDGEISRVQSFVETTLGNLVVRLSALKDAVDAWEEKGKEESSAENLATEATALGEEFLAVEKYVNVNYTALSKILKKHDKLLPATPCRQFYMSRVHHSDWISSNYSNIFVDLSRIHSKLRNDESGVENTDAKQEFVRTTRKYWVRAEDVSAVKHIVLQHLPVFQAWKGGDGMDAQLVNSVYLDNSRLELYHGRIDKRPGAIAVRFRWYGSKPPKTVFVERKTHRDSWTGEASVKERFTLDETQVVPFLIGQYSLGDHAEAMRDAGKKEEDIENMKQLFSEVRQQIDSKQLGPTLRTQYMRTAFQIPFDATVRVSLDTNLTMVTENCGYAGRITDRWCRDPKVSVMRDEITHFPHAILEVKLSLKEGQDAPIWVQELLNSGMVFEVHKFSKFIHGCATLLPDLVQSVPYWMDDMSLRDSILASAPEDPKLKSPPNEAKEHGDTAPEVGTEDIEGRNGHGNVLKSFYNAVVKKLPPSSTELTHPLLSDDPQTDLAHTGGTYVPSGGGRRRGCCNIFGAGAQQKPLPRKVPMRVEPKTFFANERTFLSWLHMAVTIGSISSALVALASQSDADEASSRMIDVVALCLLPISIFFCVYAMYTFHWRAEKIRRREDGNYDDRRGPLVLAGTLAIALSAIMIMTMFQIRST